MELTLDSTDLKQEHRNCNTSLTSFDKFRPEVQAAIRAVGHAMFRSNGNHNAIYLPKPKRSEAIILTTADYQQKLDRIGKDGKLPAELASTLKAVISAHLTSSIPVTAEPRTVEQAWDYLYGGILIKDSSCDRFYSIAVVEPDRQRGDVVRFFFQLVRRCPGGKSRICE